MVKVTPKRTKRKAEESSNLPQFEKIFNHQKSELHFSGCTGKCLRCRKGVVTMLVG